MDALDGTEIIDALLTPAGSANPYPIYARAHRLGPVSRIWDEMLLVPEYRTVHQLLRDSAFGVADAQARGGFDPTFHEHSARLLLSRSVLENNAPDHARMRSLIASVFTARRVAALAPAVRAAVDRLLTELADLGADGTAVDFMETFAFRLPVGVICELLGVPESDRFRFRDLGSALSVLLEPVISPQELATADAASDELVDYLGELADQRRAEPRGDLVSALVQVADGADGRLSDQELLANLLLLLVAGFETTTNLLGNGLALAFEHPWAADGLRSGRISSAGFVEEVLRYDSPVQLTNRLPLVEGLSVAGVPLSPTGGVLLLIGAANRDPARYDRPDLFDPTRQDSQALSFGGGPHYCLGAQLARLEATCALPALLSRFPRLAPAREPVRRSRLVLRGYQSLPVTVRG
ncbi:cytochrome P450 [Kitasatospora kifunensis]|uniref:Cytochrome P450 n=1 Tax=Kitasatospora kifunensis TaxID=58351 RepID=A0A7W7VUS7_KITKI|nr:cytochrome P450 [Kitasatospora kifunensis]MBB4922949.1 cytochrome P450 [Kitasatospora kifunensis]